MSADICRQCKSDPLFKQSLFSSYVRNRAARGLRCKYRSVLRNSRDVLCCGGTKKAIIGIYDCNLNGDRRPPRRTDPDCWLCEKYEAVVLRGEEPLRRIAKEA